VRGHTTNDQSVTCIKTPFGIEIDYASNELSNVNDKLTIFSISAKECKKCLIY